MKHTTNSYRGNPMLQGALADTLEYPHFKIAINILRELGEPLELPVPEGMDFVQFNAMQNARREGFFQALRSLEVLSIPMKTQLTSRDMMPSLVEE